MDSRVASLLPRIRIRGLVDQDSIARRTKECSSSSMVSSPTYRLDDRRCTTLLADRRIGDIAVVVSADIADSAAAWDCGHPIGDQDPLDHQDARSPRTADKLVGRNENRILGGEGIFALADRIHLDAHIRCGSREVPERQGIVSVQEHGQASDIGNDPGDVGGGRKAADLYRTILKSDEFAFEVVLVDSPVPVLVDDNHVGNGLAPGELVGVMLVRSDEHHWPLVLGDQ
jgi:hypothetical protein